MFTRNARVVLEKRYLIRDEEGALTESPQELFERVAHAVAEPESPSQRKKWAAQFLELMTSLRFLPNSPTLMNAGKKEGQLSACYVLPVEDDLSRIFDTLKQAALIHQSGGGTGFAFSRLRASGARVKSSSGVASGPVSFMRIFDTATETIKQGGTRRGANMAILSVDHPDILSFIDSKLDGRSITNFNISVGVTDAFMRAVATDKALALRDPASGNEAGRVPARQIFDRMVEAAWKIGDPGVIFLDRINRFNPTPKLGAMESTNPCGEQPLLPYESCNLGSLDLGKYVREGKFDWKMLGADIPVATRFLDNVIDANHYPVKECEKITLKNRKIGLGVMGFADALLLLGLKYDSDEARAFGETVMSFVDRGAKTASAELAKKRGAFPAWKGSMWERLGYPKLRNATVSTVAPTGTISIIAGCSSGIEPIFAGVFERNVLGGEKLREVHPAVEALLKAKGRAGQDISDSELSKLLGPTWQPAPKVSVEGHVKMQSVFQRHCDSAVSKTINLPESATRGDVAKAYELAYRLGCKGITVYRDKSRDTQVLEAVVCESCVD